jgi:hypothetical protein
LQDDEHDPVAAAAATKRAAEAKEQQLLTDLRNGHYSTGDELKDWLLVIFSLKIPEGAEAALQNLQGKLAGKAGQYVLVIEKTTSWSGEAGCFSSPQEHGHFQLTLGVLDAERLIVLGEDHKPLIPFGIGVKAWKTMDQGSSGFDRSGFPRSHYRHNESTSTVLRPNLLHVASWLGHGYEPLLSGAAQEHNLYFFVGDEEVLSWPEHELNPHPYAKAHSLARLLSLAKQLPRPLHEVPTLDAYAAERRAHFLKELENHVKVRNQALRDIEFPAKEESANPAALVAEVRNARHHIEQHLARAKDHELQEDPLVRAEAAHYNVTL